MSGDVTVDAVRLRAFATAFIEALGSPAPVAAEVAAHLVEADLQGVASHGTMRLPQYADWAREGLFDPAGQARLAEGPGHAPLVDGGNGFGMPAMRLAIDDAVARASTGGLAALGVVNVGHTGRIGAFAERAAEAGCLAILFGGGGRGQWRQVAPHGGARAMLPTNPFAFALPGDAGPLVLDFATSAGAGGKVYAARYAGRPLPEGLCIDAEGRPTTDPEDYFDGGALLPMAGPKGYGMALFAEIACAALGPARHGMNWMGIIAEPGAVAAPEALLAAAAECLADIRACPPANGFDAVEIPGERERRIGAERRRHGIAIPPATLEAMRASAAALGVDGSDLGA